MSSVDRALQRPSNYNDRSAREQWEIDDSLGLLDWDPTEEEIKEYKARIKGKK